MIVTFCGFPDAPSDVTVIVSVRELLTDGFAVQLTVIVPLFLPALPDEMVTQLALEVAVQFIMPVPVLLTVNDVLPASALIS